MARSTTTGRCANACRARVTSCQRGRPRAHPAPVRGRGPRVLLAPARHVRRGAVGRTAAPPVLAATASDQAVGLPVATALASRSAPSSSACCRPVDATGAGSRRVVALPVVNWSLRRAPSSRACASSSPATWWSPRTSGRGAALVPAAARRRRRTASADPPTSGRGSCCAARRLGARPPRGTCRSGCSCRAASTPARSAPWPPRGRGPVRTFSIGFAERSFDELADARRTARDATAPTTPSSRSTPTPSTSCRAGRHLRRAVRRLLGGADATSCHSSPRVT